MAMFHECRVRWPEGNSTSLLEDPANSVWMRLVSWMGSYNEVVYLCVVVGESWTANSAAASSCFLSLSKRHQTTISSCFLLIPSHSPYGYGSGAMKYVEIPRIKCWDEQCTNVPAIWVFPKALMVFCSTLHTHLAEFLVLLFASLFIPCFFDPRCPASPIDVPG